MKVCVPADGPGSLVWMDGLAVQASRTRAFVEALRRGEIPKPLSQASSLSAHIQVRYLSPTTMAFSAHALASILGLASPLVHLLESSKHRTCAGCGRLLKMYASPAEASQEIVEAHRDQEIDIRLRAPAERLAQWSEARGFTVQESVENGCFVELDSLRAKPENFERIRTALDLAWTLPDMRVMCRSALSTTAYTPHGYCTHCDNGAPAISRRNIAAFLLNGATDLSSPELFLHACGITLKELLTSPLSALQEQLVSSGILSADLRSALEDFGLQGLCLGRTADTLSASVLARVAVIAAALNGSNDDSLTVLDIPFGLLSASDKERGAHLLEHSALRRTVVVLERHGERLRETFDSEASTPSGISLGTLRILALHDPVEREIQLFRGSYHQIVSKDESASDPLAKEVYDAISGKPRCTVAYSLEHPCEAQLVGLRPLPSNSRRILAQEFGLYEPLTKLYSSALEARMRGLTPKDFNLSSRSKRNYLCPECRGVGVILESLPNFERPQARPCLVCSGMRFRSPIKEIEFRGRPFWRVLNSTFHEEANVLRALPKVGKTLSLLSLLKLDHLPIGMPTALLSFSESRLTAIVTSILSASTSKPPVLVIEEPFAGLSSAQAEGLTKLMRGHEIGKDVTWVAVTHVRNHWESSKTTAKR